MPQQEFIGRTPAEAAIAACEALGVSRSELKFEIVSDAGEGLERKVTISAEASEAVGKAVEAKATEGEENYNTESYNRDYSSDEGESRGRRGGRDRGRGRSNGRRSRGGPRGRRDDNDGIEKLLDLKSKEEAAIPLRDEIAGEGSEKAKIAAEVLGEIIKRSGLSLSTHLVQDDEEEIHIDLRGGDEEKLIGKKGDPLLSLQFLLNRIVSRRLDGEGGAVVVLDAANYRGRRRDALADLATKLAERAAEENKVVRLAPMSAHDRRVFHLTLKEREDVSTRSEGDGLHRKLLIIPAEYA